MPTTASARCSLGTDVGPLSFEIERERPPHAARLLTAGRGMATPDGGPGFPAIANTSFPITTAEEGRQRVRELRAQGAHAVKIWVDDRNGRVKKLTPDLYRPIIEEAHAQGLMALAHVYYLDDAHGLVDAGVDGFMHLVRDKVMDAALIAKMKAKNVFAAANIGGSRRAALTELPAPTLPLLGETVPAAVVARVPGGAQGQGSQGRRDRPRHLRDHGEQPGPSHRCRRDHRARRRTGIPGAWHGWAEQYEMETMVAGGMTPAQVIVASTSTPARILKLDDMGNVATGKSADFIVLEANPLDDIANTARISAIYLRGEMLDRAAMRMRWTPAAAQRVSDARRQPIEGHTDGLWHARTGLLLTTVALAVGLGAALPRAQGDAAAIIARIEAPQAPDRQGFDGLTLQQVMQRSACPASASPWSRTSRCTGPRPTASPTSRAAGGGGDTPLPGGVDQQAGDGDGGDAAGPGRTARPRRRRQRVLKSWKVPETRPGAAGDAAVALQPHVGRRRRVRVPRLRPAAPRPTVVQILNGQAPSNVGRVLFARPPFQGYKYSGGGVTIMQLALTELPARPFAALMRATVLGPLQMTEQLVRAAARRPSWRRGSRAPTTARAARWDRAWHVYPEQAAAGLWTTPSDLARFIIEVQRGAWPGRRGAVAGFGARDDLARRRRPLRRRASRWSCAARGGTSRTAAPTGASRPTSSATSARATAWPS